jgi:hypothetical protein
LNWIQIELKKNGMKIDEEGIEILFVNMILEFYFFQKDQLFWKHTVSCFLIWEWAKQISVWNSPRDNNNL